MVAAVRPFRFGVVTAFARSADDWLTRARRIEELGYSTLVMPDNLRYILAPLPALAMAAAVTRTLRLGTYVLANDLRHPVLLAKDLATLDCSRVVASSSASAPAAPIQPLKTACWDCPSTAVRCASRVLPSR